MKLEINRGMSNGKSYCYWMVNNGAVFEGGIYHDREWSEIFGKQVTVKEIDSDSVHIHLGVLSKLFDFAKAYLFVNKSPEVIHKELTDIRNQVFAWFNTIDRHETFVIDLDTEIPY